MKYLALATLLFSFLSQACQYRGKPDIKDPLIDGLNGDGIIVIVSVERIYHRKDKCSNAEHCVDSGLVLKVLEVLRGKVSNYVEAYKAVYTSCFSGHPNRKYKPGQNGAVFLPSYSVGNEYLMVLEERDDDYVVVAGKELELSLMLLKSFREEIQLTSQ